MDVKRGKRSKDSILLIIKIRPQYRTNIFTLIKLAWTKTMTQLYHKSIKLYSTFKAIKNVKFIIKMNQNVLYGVNDSFNNCSTDDNFLKPFAFP